METEVQYWTTLANGTTRDVRAAQAFLKYLTPLRQTGVMIESSGLADIAELRENAILQLADLWQQADTPQSFPEDRMQNIFEHFQQSLVRAIQNSATTIDIWAGGYYEVQEFLTDCRDTCDNWIRVSRSLTEDWTEFSKNSWKSGALKYQMLEKMKARLTEISEIRTVVHDAENLLGAFGKRSPLEIFLTNSIDCFDISAAGDSAWATATYQFEARMQRFDETVIENIRNKFRNMIAAPIQMLLEFQKSASFMKRPKIKKDLFSERETMLTSLGSVLSQYEDEFAKDNSTIYANQSKTISRMIWLRQLHLKIEETDTGLVSALSDLPKFDGLYKRLTALKESVKVALQRIFDEWCDDLLRMMQDPKGDLSLDTSGHLMKIEQPSGRLIVNFSDRLVMLIREVRWLESVGYRIPSEIMERYQLAKKFHESGIVLMQVAHFYNTIDQQMIPCQKPMMIESAKRFEQIIRHGRGTGSGGGAEIRWSDAKRVEAYVNDVHDATMEFTQENRRLRSLHQKVIAFIIQMTGTSLSQKTSEWKKLLNEIHKVVASVAVDAQRYPPENILSWRVHIDYQIVKAIEIQLRRSLLALAENLPDQQVDLIYRNRMLQVRPSIPELRQLFSQHMQKLFAIPATLKPLSEISEKRGLFKQAARSCHLEAATVQQNFEEVLKRIEEEMEEYRPYVILGSVDIPVLVSARVNVVQDWDQEFKALKYRGRLVDQIPAQTKVENMTINLGGLRMAIDGLLQDAYDALVDTLRKSIASDIQTAADFVAEATSLLASRPTTTDELNKLSTDYYRLLKISEEIKPKFTIVEEKSALLKSVGARNIEKSESVLRSWNGIMEMLEDHRSVMRDQTASLRVLIEKDIKKFNDDVEKFAARWQQNRPSVALLDNLTIFQMGQISETIQTRRDDLQVLSKRYDELTAQCSQLDMDVLPSNSVPELLKEMDVAEKSWKDILEFVQQLDGFINEDWLIFRNKLYNFEDFLKSWTVRLQPAIPTSFTLRIQNEVERFRAALPALKACRGESFSDEHWGELFRILSLNHTNLDKLTFGDLLRSADAVATHAQAIRDLASRAQAEISIREALRELEIWGATAGFSVTVYKDASENAISIVKDWTVLLSSVGEKQRLIQSTKDSQHYGKFSDRIAVWEQRLGDLSFLLETLHQIQRKWIYLEPICSRNTIPSEEGRFKRADTDFRSVMKDVSKDARLLSWMRPGLKGLLPNVLDQLQRCQKALNDFLETKRLAFPRFYFIGDEDLLEILGQSGNPKVVQAHVRKLFAGVRSVNFGPDDKEIVAVKSPEGEVLKLSSSIKISGSVEVWLSALSEELKRTLRLSLKECLLEPPKNDLVLKYPAQVLRLVDRVRFTKDVEAVLRAGKGDLDILRSNQQQKLNELTGMQYNNATEVKTATAQSLILDTIYRLEVLDILTNAKVNNVESWLWQKQLRFYNDASSNVTVRMVDAEFDYSFEYQGCFPGLVHTPLTDKCFLTLTQAMLMGLGGNPYGPAGTGKTESVKELGAQLGRQVLVFNCDEGIDPKSMGRIFIGLLKCGAWGCFDEFNRLDELTLSAISTQILAIQAALKDSSKQLELLDRKVEINKNAGIFITLNPASKGYGGRVKLPDNLKQLFRPIAMTIPDARRIAEVVLLSEGFQSAKSLGKKLTTLYTCSRELLSKQQHYDWGLRAIKSTVQMGGRAISQYRSQSGKESIDEAEETAILVQALRSNVVSKLTTLDQKRFEQMIRDIFPNFSDKRAENVELGQALIGAFEELHLIVNESQVQKAIELHGQLAQRMGVVVVGPAGSGKTTIWKLLTTAMKTLNTPVTYHLLNPTSMPKTQLLGLVDESTREWTDGVLTRCVREVLKEATEHPAWIVFDGDIDPDWIESLNSVLDDNRLLTLASGERLRFPANVNFLFETNDLSAASPATVSRMGMIFLSSENVVMRTIVDAWIRKQPADSQPVLSDFASSLLFNMIEMLKAKEGQTAQLTDVALCANVLSQLADTTDRADLVVRALHSLGGLLSNRQQDDFGVSALKLAGYDPVDVHKPFNVYYDPDHGMLKSYRLRDLKASETNEPYFPCISQHLAIFRILPWIKSGNSLLMFGPPLCGKTRVLEQVFQQLQIRSVIPVHCSSSTTAHVIIQKLKQNCLSIPAANGRIMRPKGSDRLVVCIENLHVVKRDRWGHSQVEALLRQMISQGGFYDSNADWIQLDGIQFIATSHTDSSGIISDRLTSVMRVTYLGNPDVEDLQSISAGYLQTTLTANGKTTSHPVWSQQRNLEKLVVTLSAIFTKLFERFGHSAPLHYSVTLQDLVTWITGLARYDVADPNGVTLLTASAFEAARIFRDKLMVSSDAAFFDAVVLSCFKRDWPSMGIDTDILYSSMGGESSASVVDGAPLSGSGRKLSKIKDEEVRLSIRNAIRRLNRESIEMEVYIHRDLVDVTMRTDHWLGVPGGSVLLLGPSGHGRRLAAVVASKTQQAIIFRPRIVRDYAARNFRLNLKKVLEMAYKKNENTVFILEDCQVTDPVFLETVCVILQSGEIDFPGLFTDEELEKVYGNIADELAQENFDGVPAVFIANRIRRNFHCIFTLDSKSSRVSALFDRIPSLATMFHIIWLDSLPETILTTIPQMAIAAGSPTSDAPNSESAQFATYLTFIHQNSPEHLRCTSRFIQLIRTYRSVKDTMTSDNRKASERLQAGLDQLNKAQNAVMGLKREVTQQHNALADKQEEARRAMDEIRESMAGASTQKDEVTVLRADLETEKVKLQQREQLIAKELQDVLPMLEAAKQSVTAIKTTDLSEIKSLRAPPAVIHNILEGVLKLFGNKDTSWSGMRAFLSPTIKEEIVHFNADKVSKEHLKLTQQLLDKYRSSFEEDTAKRASVAAAPLAVWVRACCRYAEVHEKIAPLAHEKRKLESTIEMHSKRVTNADKDLGNLSSRIDILQARFQQLTEEAAFMKIELNRLTERLKVAEFLVEKLESEHSRWSSQLKNYAETLKTIQNNALLAAGFVVYLAACSEDERTAYVNSWKEYLKVTSFDLSEQLTTETMRLEWRTQELPADTLSIENAIILRCTLATCLIVDPTGNVQTWLKTSLKQQSVEVVDQEDTNFQSTLEMAVRFGKALIVEVADRVDGVLVALLRRDLIKQGTRMQVEMGDKLIDYHPQFRLYLVSRNPSIEVQLHPQIAALITVVSFTATRAGLANQLLSLVIESKLPQVEQRRRALVQEQESLKIKLTELENALLLELTNSQGNILENAELRESLSKTKTSSDTVEKNLNESRKIKETLDRDQAIFSVLATKCCSIYFALQSLHKLNHLYRFSLQTFIEIFRKAVENLAKNDEVKDQLQKFCAVAFYQVIHYVYHHVSRAVFKKDRLTFLLQLIKSVRPELIKQEEWEFLLSIKARTLDSSDASANFPWLDKDKQGSLAEVMKKVPSLREAMDLPDSAGWSKFMGHSHCETAFPTGAKLTVFQQVVVIAVLRPDRMISALTGFAGKGLKLPDLASDTTLKTVLVESKETVPILILTSAGSDPSQEILGLAQERSVQCQQFAMGVKESDNAADAIKEAAQKGIWLYLKNLHLLPTFFNRILKEIKDAGQPAPSFRLWISTEAIGNIPPLLLETSLKCVYEAPPGVKQNIVRSVKESSDMFKSISGSASSRPALILYWLHAILQERRNYLPVGWTKFYEFTTGDLSAALRIIGKYGKAPKSGGYWEEYIRGLLEIVIYGGRVDSRCDTDILASFVGSYFSPNVLAKDDFGKALSGRFQPSLKSLSDFAGYVQHSLPEMDEPELLGLPANIDASHQINEGLAVLKDLQLLQHTKDAKLSEMAGDWMEAVNSLISSSQSTKQKLEKFVTDQEESEQINPLAWYYLYEGVFALDLVDRIHRELTAIATHGRNLEALAKDVQATARNIMQHETPESWQSAWSGPVEPTFYLRTVDRLSHALTEGMGKINRHTLLSAPVDVRQLFNPENFISSLRQLASRETGRSVETLSFSNEWTITTLKSIPYTVQISGLYVEGALFDGKSLTECQYNSLGLALVVPCYIAWLPKTIAKKTEKNVVYLPVFTTLSREKLAFYLSVPCDDNPSKWIRAGAAFFLLNTI